MTKKNIYVQRIFFFGLIAFAFAVIAFLAFRDGKQTKAATTGTVTAEGLYLRVGPSKESDVVTVLGKQVILTKGAYVAVKYEDNGWYCVDTVVDGKIVSGFASAKYITVTYVVPTGKPTDTPTPTPSKAPEPEHGNDGAPEGTTMDVQTAGFPLTGYVVATALNVRNGAGTSFEAVDQLPSGSIVTVKACEQAANKTYWYRIDYIRQGASKEGYVSAAYIAVELKVTPTPSVTPTLSPENSNVRLYGFPLYGKVTADALNVRDEADISGAKVTVILQDFDVSVTGVKLNSKGEYWYEIYFFKNEKAYTGFVLSEYLDVDPPNATPTPTPTMLPTVTPTPYPGSVPGVDLTPTPDPYRDTIRYYEIPVSERGTLKFGGTVNASPYLNVRKEASTSSDIVGMLPQGTYIIVLDKVKVKDVLWYRMAAKTEGQIVLGYVSAAWTDVDETKEVSSATPTPTPRPTDTPLPTKTPTKTPTPKPKYTATMTPTPTLSGIPTPATYEYADGYPQNKAGNYVTGYGILNDSVKGFTPLYIKPSTMSPVVTDADGNSVYLKTDDVLFLYDCYRAGGGGTVFRHVNVKHDGISYYGYIRESFIEVLTGEAVAARITPTPVPEMAKLSSAQFEQYLKQEGFPESYIEPLTVLHGQNPAWVFRAYHTGIDWETAVDRESKAGENLLPNSMGYEYMSTQTGAYDWLKDEYIVFDSPYWVTVSREALEYYMDPRNFLSSPSIFQFETLAYNKGYQTIESIEKLLVGTPLSGKHFSYTDANGKTKYITYAQAFLEAAEYAGISPYHLVTRVRQEVVTSGGALSYSASGTYPGYEGYYNFYNIGAYHSSETSGAIVNALKYAKFGTTNNDEFNDKSLIPWDNEYNAIVGGAVIIAEQYIEQGQDTVYLQKYNVTPINTYWHQYMANVGAPGSEATKMAKAYSDPADTVIVFSIPVYDNMPDEPAPLPEPQGNPNNVLRSLKLFTLSNSQLSLSPSFDPLADCEYSVTMSESENYLRIEAAAVSDKALVEGTGLIVVNRSGELFEVNVTSESGSTRTYRIRIYKK